MSSEERHTCLSEEDLTPILQKYEVLKVLGEGCFGKVLKCQDRYTMELVALKVIKKDKNSAFYFKNELESLELIEILDPDIFNLVRCIEHFESNGCQCIAFEILDKTVHDLMKERSSFPLNELRPMAKQLLKALLGLQSIGVVHSDIKPDNIMLVKHKEQPFKVKLIDFGLARHISEVRIGEKMQPIRFRAPEVSLGLPLCEAVDMWGLECCLTIWHLGWPNMTSLSEFDNLMLMVDMLGNPPDELLNKGLYTGKYFVHEKSKWQLKTLEDYEDSTGDEPEIYEYRDSTSLEELIMESFEFGSSDTSNDKRDFYDFLKKMLEIDPNKRIKPVEALRHPFIIMEHLSPGKNYTDAAHKYMIVCETNLELEEREDIEQIAEMCIIDRKEDIARKALPNNLEISQNAYMYNVSEGMYKTSSNVPAESCAFEYLNPNEDDVFPFMEEKGSVEYEEENTMDKLMSLVNISSGERHPCIPEEDLCLSLQKYEVLEVLGEGCFGKVLKCLNRFSKEQVALKVIKKDENDALYFQKELESLDLIKELDPDDFNLIRFIEHFETNGCHCMAFEILDRSMHDLMLEKKTFPLNELRPMTKQLLTALLGLRTIGVVHSDIKPDNIMLVNHNKHPFKVKLIDFGVARHISQVQIGEIMQPIRFRAPEVSLGLPLCEAVDMWGLACCLSIWHLGWPTIASFSEFDNLMLMVDMLGNPPDELLNQGLYTDKYFVQEESKWRLKTLQEYEDSTNEHPEVYEYRDNASLEELIMEACEVGSKDKLNDTKAFCDLLRKMFNIDPNKRIKPAEALHHPFIKMEHMSEGNTEVAHKYMSDAEMLTLLTEQNP